MCLVNIIFINNDLFLIADKTKSTDTHAHQQKSFLGTSINKSGN